MSHGHSHGGQECHGHGAALPELDDESVVGLFGENLVSKASDGSLTSVSTIDALSSVEFIILYFSAAWCPPCRSFSPLLDEFLDANASRLKTTCIFVSGDKTQQEFEKYFFSHKWPLAVTFDGVRKLQLNQHFDVQGIPTVVVLDKKGAVITLDARGDVMTDPTGVRFPWAPRSLVDVFAEIDNGDKVINNKGEFVDKGYFATYDYVLVYFADFGSPPCRKMTPHLSEWYNKHKEGKKFEILFVSNDAEEPSFKLASETVPWLSLTYTSEQANVALAKIFEVEGIPTLGLIKMNNGVPVIANKSILRKVMVRPEDFPWKALPACSLEEAAEDGFLNESPCLLLFTDKLTDSIFESQVLDAFSQIASEFFDIEAGEPTNELRFVVASEGDAAVDSIRKFLGLLSDKDGVASVRLILINIPDQAKAEMRIIGGGMPSVDSIRTFVQKFVKEEKDFPWEPIR
jgi:thiol-disulfide isomerase/thioredoxin